MGQSGVLGRVWFTSISTYAQRSGISGSDFWLFEVMLRAVDDEYLLWAGEKYEEELKKLKNKGGG
ncbi:MAG: hypothetical protein WDM91_10885 [Rhizomicrobium sp.]